VLPARASTSLVDTGERPEHSLQVVMHSLLENIGASPKAERPVPTKRTREDEDGAYRISASRRHPRRRDLPRAHAGTSPLSYTSARLTEVHQQRFFAVLPCGRDPSRARGVRWRIHGHASRAAHRASRAPQAAPWCGLERWAVRAGTWARRVRARLATACVRRNERGARQGSMPMSSRRRGAGGRAASTGACVADRSPQPFRSAMCEIRCFSHQEYRARPPHSCRR
jgi:hypothetical protein